MPLSRSPSILFGAALLALTPAVAGSQPVQAISQADRAQGEKANPQLVAEFGGAMTGPQARYVETVGKTIAVQSGLSNAKSDFTVTLLNSPVNNAFAIPGGFVYVTRDLVSLMNNEAELAGVLGHEVGHVAARHSAKRQSAATRNGIIGAIGSVLSGVLFGNSALGQIGQSVATQGTQLLTLKYSRGQETEADNLGVDYLRRAGYDPRAMGTVLQSLANENALEARLQGSAAANVPAWASTHPDPAARVRAALARAGSGATGRDNRKAFLDAIRGLPVGDDPKQGVAEGRKFIHPVYRFAFEAPQGFALSNGTDAVTIAGQSGQGKLTTAAYNGNLEAYVRSAFAGLSEQSRIEPQDVRRTTVNGIPVAYGTAQVNSSSSGVLNVAIYAYEFRPDQAFHFVTIVRAGQANPFEGMVNSMRRISEAEAGSVRARKIDVVTVRSGDTVQSLARRMAYTDYQLERFLVLNALTSSSRLTPGQQVKIAVY